MLWYRPGKQKDRCVGERGVVVYLNVLVYVSALNGDGLKRQLSEWINSKALPIQELQQLTRRGLSDGVQVAVTKQIASLGRAEEAWPHHTGFGRGGGVVEVAPGE